MTRTMYDSVNVATLPTGGQLYAGYVGGLYPTYNAMVARFPNAIHVSIAVNASEVAQVLDVENGDASPAQAPAWCVRMRSRGIVPSVYCSTSTWTEVRAAFAAARVAEPSYWLAHYDVPAVVLDGSVALQYRDAGPYDVSIVADYWPGIDPAPNPNPAPGPAPVPSAPPSIPMEGTAVQNTLVPVTTDANGDGAVICDGSAPQHPLIPFAQCYGVGLNGSNPFADTPPYATGYAKRQPRNGNVLITVIGAVPNSNQNVWVTWEPTAATTTLREAN